MRAWWLLFVLGCSKSDDDKAWDAYQAEVEKAVNEGLPPFDPNQPPKPTTPSWYGMPDAFYDAWYGSGLNEKLHRPSWNAQRLLEREMLKSSAITLGFSIGAPPPSDKAVDVLIASASHADPNVRARAIFILCDIPKLGERPDALPKLLPATGAGLADPNGVVRASAAYALGRLLEEVEGDKSNALSELARLLKDPEPFVRYNAAVAITKLGGASDEVVAVLRADLRHENWWVVGGAAAGLRRLGPRAKAAAPDLVELLRHPVDTCRRNAYAALETIDSAALTGPYAEKVRQEMNPRTPY
jgi:HEAT repeat protein